METIREMECVHCQFLRRCAAGARCQLFDVIRGGSAARCRWEGQNRKSDAVATELPRWHLLRRYRSGFKRRSFVENMPRIQSKVKQDTCVISCFLMLLYFGSCKSVWVM